MKQFDVDPVTVQIIRNALMAITDQIDKNITRTAFTPLIYEYKDFSVGILDAEGRVIAQGRGSLPIFVANALGVAVKDGLDIYGLQNMHAGDVMITNHSGTMGQHLNNVVMYTPIVASDSDGERTIGFMAVLMHWMDVGGGIVGSCFGSDTTDIFQEGIQFRTVKLYRRGDPVEEIFRMIRYNTRFPEMVLGDIASQYAGVTLGRQLVEKLVGKYGLDQVQRAIEIFWDQADRAARSSLAKIPAGTYKASSFLDDDGVHMGQRIPVEVKVVLDGDRIKIDFSGLAEELGGPLNAGFNGGAVAAARIACKYLFAAQEPGNDGAFRMLDVSIPPGKFLSAGPTAPMGGSGYTLPTVVDTIIRALAPAAPERVSAGHHATYGIHVFHGTHPVTGALFQHLESAVGGWGATLSQDGAWPCRSLVHGDMLDTPAELFEARYPLRVLGLEALIDSAGAGRQRGGLGTTKTIEVLGACTLTVYFERTECKAWGLESGLAGVSGYVEVVRSGAETHRILKGSISLLPGDVVHVISGAGGGYGSPRERDPVRVADDVRDGYVSRDAALEIYGVVLDENFNVNEARTASLRANHGDSVSHSLKAQAPSELAQ